MSETSEPELPRAVALAWGVAAHPQRGPKRELSIERIVDTAVALADEGGLAAVSMSSVATALGFTPMSLYRYITSKDDLLVLMQERGIGLPPERVLEADGWRAGLHTWAHATAEAYLEHPWLLDIPIDGTPSTPNNLAWLDAALTVLAPVAASDDAKLGIVLALIAQVRWQATVERGYRAVAARGDDPEEHDAGIEALLAELVTVDEFPAVRRAIDAGAFSPVPGGDPFAFGLERLLDGIQSYLDAGSAAAPDPTPADPIEAQAARDPKVKEAVRARREAERQLREARKRERERMREARERLRR
ncbi:TetR/AcrR family transcriptional regulator [Protaetiibacter larvae]|uniref:TetR/AcrR family transcriptional regulator n=1 Tax=Protaetiibacter larvae TaxID=2592654 RepID=A0A5C1Y6U5_9MICO|nr:TetR/AcrR family transcriptional regulator [Protaetiibacter larvae]QEO09634.1 TetR/AcrR family transcriptional regulator [Protaetiibacter larvae]